jgi:DNA-binding LacI/PurR family transcriptional regulator
VSRVANGSPHVSPEAKIAVELSIDALGYLPNRAARSLVTMRSGSIALVVSEPEYRLFSDLRFGALRVLKAAGRRVPDDVALIGFDDSITATHTDPQLTSLRQPVEDLGRELAKLLLMPLQADTAPLYPVILPTELVVREST